MATIHRLSAQLQSDSGVVIAEFAMLLPVLLLLAFGMVDMQWMARDAQAIEYIATESARCEAIAAASCPNASTTKTYAEQLGQNVHLALNDSQVTVPNCNGQTCSVTIEYQFVGFGPWFPKPVIVRVGMAAQAPAS